MFSRCLFVLWLTLQVSAQEENVPSYGVDCSFPIHSKEFRCGGILGDRQAVYDDFMEGCRKRYGRKADRCDSTENDRIEMSIRQPQSMVNYTDTGFMKIKAPREVMSLLEEHWNRNHEQMKEEVWGVGNVYVNHWKSSTYMVSVEDASMLRGRGRGNTQRLKKEIWDASKSTIEQWTGMEQKPTSMYGIRVYTEGAILSPHVDRLPLVSSAIINVAQDVDEPWPLEVIDRQGRAVNVTMEPGDMVLYESGSLIHARPFPLKGRFFANIFIHFEPTGRPLSDTSFQYLKNLDDFLPPYILPGSPEEPNWRMRNPQGWNKPSPSAAQVDTPEAHFAAQQGDVAMLARLHKENKFSVHQKDRNGWQPLHEAVRSGHKDAVQLLIEEFGADKNARTHGGSGSSPLNLASGNHDKDHPVNQYLKSIGALNIAPDEL